LGDYIQQLQKVNSQPDQPCFACEPSRPDESKFDHICPNNPILTCNCTDPKFCAELGSDPDRQYRDTAGNDGFADNINYTHIEGPPLPANTAGENAVRGWPCVVVGAVPQTWVTASECVLRTTAGEWNTKRNTDAGLNNDGPATTTGL
jgi:hypothetical protein